MPWMMRLRILNKNKKSAAKSMMQKAVFYGIPFLLSCVSYDGWKYASRASSGLAPRPEKHKGAVIQVFAAPLWGFRGRFADHTWIAVKNKGASGYTVYEVIGWRKKAGYHSVLRIEKDIPDRLWFGNAPRLLIDLRGEKAEPWTDKIHKAAAAYPYKTKYAMILGPNSNTFTAWIACRLPGLNIPLSWRAFGKNYIKNCQNP